VKPSTATQPGVLDGRALADRIFTRVRQQDQIWGTYTLELTFDALLEFHRATGAVPYRDHVMAVLDRRKVGVEHYASTRWPFAHLDYTLYRCLGHREMAEAFVQVSRRLIEQVDRSPDGLVLHRSGRRAPCVLIDFMQDYIARMARVGHLTGEAAFFAEVEMQACLHRALLRDPDSGLWRQGRGWDAEDPDALSPGAWSRGQGWVLRGLLDSLDALPAGLPTSTFLRACLRELLDALLGRQDEEGLWHCLVDRPLADSAPETSGSALIAAALYRSLAAGHLEGVSYRHAADRALAAVARRVDDEGRVAGACAGPGPLTQPMEHRYLGRAFPEEESHGCFAVLYACAAQASLESSRPSPTAPPRA
jgi:unsaturated rhamnogalacturonyl hydrolase